jgi:hypothetical protein
MEVSGQLHAPAALPPGKAAGTHWIGGWVGPRGVLDAVMKRKIPRPRQESNPRTPIVLPVAQRYTDWAITAHLNEQIWSRSDERLVFSFRVPFDEWGISNNKESLQMNFTSNNVRQTAWSEAVLHNCRVPDSCFICC